MTAEKVRYLRLRDERDKPFLTIRLSIVTSHALEPEARSLLAGDPRARALLGMDLIDRPQWRVAGASLLWAHACQLPAAAAAARELYQVESVAVICSHPLQGEKGHIARYRRRGRTSRIVTSLAISSK